MSYALGDFTVPADAHYETWPAVMLMGKLQPAQTIVHIPLGKLASHGGTIADIFNVRKPPGCISITTEEDGSVMALVELPPGVHKLAKPEDCAPYTSFHPRAISLASCENDENAKAIKFEAELELALDFEKLSSKKSYIESLPVPLYHAHVLWAYAVRIDRGKDNFYSISIVSARSHLSHRDDDDFAGTSRKFHPRGLRAPRARDVQLRFLNADDDYNIMDFTPSKGDDFATTRQFTKQELLGLAVGGNFKMCLHMTVNRSYFSLQSIIDLEKPYPTVSEDTKAIVATILRGGKPDGWDWEITGMGRSRLFSTFYVHKAGFIKTSGAIKDAFKRGRDMIGNVRLLDGGQRAHLNDLTDEDVKTAIQIAYGIPLPLPKWRDCVRLSKYAIYHYFESHYDKTIFPQWEREMCRVALTLDTRDPASSIPALLRFASLVWESRMGWFPIAERIVAGVLADVVHLNARASEEQFLKEEVMSRLDEAGCAGTTRMMRAVESMQLLLHATQRVRKAAIVDSVPQTDVAVVDSDAMSDVSDEADSSSESYRDHWRGSSSSDCTSEEEPDKADEVNEKRDEYDVEAGDVGV